MTVVTGRRSSGPLRRFGRRVHRRRLRPARRHDRDVPRPRPRHDDPRPGDHAGGPAPPARVRRHRPDHRGDEPRLRPVGGGDRGGHQRRRRQHHGHRFGGSRGVCDRAAVGLGAGLVNGLLVGYLRLPAIIVTLATWSILAGVALYVLPQPGGEVAPGFADFPLQRSGRSRSRSSPWSPCPAWRGGRSPARGSGTACSPSAATNGPPTRAASTSPAPRWWRSCSAGCSPRSAALFLTMQAASGDPRIGDTFTLNSIAAVALGGALLSGGRGSVAASVAGALVLATLAQRAVPRRRVHLLAVHRLRRHPRRARSPLSSLTRGRMNAGTT